MSLRSGPRDRRPAQQAVDVSAGPHFAAHRLVVEPAFPRSRATTQLTIERGPLVSQCQVDDRQKPAEFRFSVMTPRGVITLFWNFACLELFKADIRMTDLASEEPSVRTQNQWRAQQAVDGGADLHLRRVPPGHESTTFRQVDLRLNQP